MGGGIIMPNFDLRYFSNMCMIGLRNRCRKFKEDY